MWLLIAAAEADQAFEAPETDPCSEEVQVEGILPRDGDVVPPDVVVVLVHDNACGQVAFPTLFREPELDLAVPAATEFVADTVVRLVPFEPLAPGAYQVQVVQREQVVRFTVGEGSFATPSPPALEAEFGGACGALTTLTADVTASFPDAAADQRGLVVLLPSVDGVPGPPEAAAVYEGQATVELSADVIGGRRLCVSLALEDLAGERVWETDEVCGDEFVCEAVDEGDEPGCGCATGDGGAVEVLGGLVLLARRRR